MPIKVNNITVIENDRKIKNIPSITFSDNTIQTTAFDTSFQKSIYNRGNLVNVITDPNMYNTVNADYFGGAGQNKNSIDLSGNYCIVGAYYEDDSQGSTAGKAYIFNVKTGQLIHILNNPFNYSTNFIDGFGYSVAISGNYCAVSAPYEDASGSGGVDSGKIFIFNVNTGQIVKTISNPSQATYDYFGTSLAMSGNYLIAGVLARNVAYIFNVTTGALVWTLNNPNAYSTSISDDYGFSVAISGNYCIVGAPGEDDASGTGSGKAYIFNVTTGALVWTLNNPNAYSTSTNDYFGYSVAISGNYCVVGAYYEDENLNAGQSASGKAYVFNVTTGVLVHTLNNPNVYKTPGVVSEVGDNFGDSVAITDKYVIVSAPFDRKPFAYDPEYQDYDAGTIYIFDVTSGTLLKTCALFDAYSSFAQFGRSLAASDTYGNYFIASDRDYFNGSSGRVSVIALEDIVELKKIDEISLVNSNSNFQQNHKLFDKVYSIGSLVHALNNPNAYSTSTNDYFGSYVAISDNYAIVGAYQEDDASGLNSGKAYIFNVTTGELVQTLNNPNAYSTSSDDNFGSYVAISSNYAIVGVPGEDDSGGANSGKVYVFNVTTGELVQTLNNPNAYSTSSDDYFGSSLAISGDYAIVGAPWEDDSQGIYAGKAYIFNVTTGALVQTLNNPNPILPDSTTSTADDNFGFSVAISGSHCAVSAPNDDDPTYFGTNSGRVYIYDIFSGQLIRTLNNPNAYSYKQDDFFGVKISMSGDYCLVSSTSEADSNLSPNSGVVYVFNFRTNTLIQTILNPNSYSTGLNDYFGQSISINNNKIIVSAYYEDDSDGSNSGVVYIFNATTGSLIDVIRNPNAYSTSSDDNFGSSVAISGNYAIVSAIGEDDSGGASSGKVYIYSISNQTYFDKLIPLAKNLSALGFN